MPRTPACGCFEAGKRLPRGRHRPSSPAARGRRARGLPTTRGHDLSWPSAVAQRRRGCRRRPRPPARRTSPGATSSRPRGGRLHRGAPLRRRRLRRLQRHRAADLRCDCGLSSASTVKSSNPTKNYGKTTRSGFVSARHRTRRLIKLPTLRGIRAGQARHEREALARVFDADARRDVLCRTAKRLDEFGSSLAPRARLRRSAPSRR